MKKNNLIIQFITATFMYMALLSCAKEHPHYFHGYSTKDSSNIIYHTLEISEVKAWYNKGKISDENQSFDFSNKNFKQWFDTFYEKPYYKVDTIFVHDSIYHNVDYWVRKDLNYITFVRDLSSLDFINHTPVMKKNGYKSIDNIQSSNDAIIHAFNIGYPKKEILNGRDSVIVPDPSMGFDISLYKDSLYVYNLSKYVDLAFIYSYLNSYPDDYYLLLDADKDISDEYLILTFTYNLKHKPIKTYRTSVNGAKLDVFVYELE